MTNASKVKKRIEEIKLNGLIINIWAKDIFKLSTTFISNSKNDL